MVPKIITINPNLDFSHYGYRNLSTYDIVKNRVESINSKSNSVLLHWWGSSFETTDALIIHPNGGLKIILDEGKTINTSNSTLNKYNIAEFTKIEVLKYSNLYGTLKKRSVKENPIWLTLLREDNNLLKEYVKINHPQNNKLLDLFIPHINTDIETKSYLRISGLGIEEDITCDSLKNIRTKLKLPKERELIVSKYH